MIELAPAPDYIQEKRACIAAFMDAHPEIFAMPSIAASWMAFIELSVAPDEREERILAQATGSIVQAVRSAQDRTPSDLDMKSVLDQARDEGAGDLEPDPAIMAISGADPDDEAAATMARAMSLYKHAIQMGVADGSELQQTIESSFSELPATTPFMQSLLDTAKRIVLIDLDHAMRQA